MAKPLVIAALIVAFVGRCLANEDPAPPVTVATLPGVWEGIAGQQLYRMELLGGEKGYLAFMTRPADRQLAAVFRLTSARVTGGRVALEFRNVARESFASEQVSLEGRGFAFADGVGGISAKLTFRGRSNYAFDMEFSKGAVTRMLAKMSTDAEQLIAREKAKHRE